MTNAQRIIISSWLSLAVAGAAEATLIDRGGGLIYDDVLNVTWLQDAQYAAGSTEGGFGRMTWLDAKTWTLSLEFYDSARGVLWDDWRMPTTVNSISSLGFDTTGASSELAYMYYINLGFTPNLTHDPLAPNPSSSNYNPFINLAFRGYWSETLSPSRDTVAWLTHFHFGSNEFSDIGDGNYVWAVRDGDVGAPVNVPEPGTLALLGLGLAGMLFERRRGV